MSSYFEEFTSRVIAFLPELKELETSEDGKVSCNYEVVLKEYNDVCSKLEGVGYSAKETLTEASAVFEYALRKFASAVVGEGSNSTGRSQPPNPKRRKTGQKTEGPGNADNRPVMSWLPGILALAMKLALESKISKQAPFMILDDVLEAQPITVCEEIWGLVESLSHTMADASFVPSDTKKNPSSKLWLLRLSNCLLKRLSTTQNAAFCGRISLFIAYAFPLSDRSGVNIRKDRNTENVTIFDEKSVFESDINVDVFAENGEKSDLQGDAGNGAAVASSKKTIDYDVYKAFWSLQQDFFRDPRNMIDDGAGREKKTKEALQSEFMQKLERVLSLFENHPLVKSRTDKSTESVGDFYCAKYLTTARLFRLQLIDPEVRRHVLCQTLIVFEDIKNSVGAEVMNAMKKLRTRTLDLLSNSGPDGKRFKDGVLHSLRSVRSWKTWKDCACPPYEREAPEGQKEEDQKGRRQLLVALKDAKAKASAKGSKDQISQRRAKSGLTVQPGLMKLWKERDGNFDLLRQNEAPDTSINKWYEPVVDAEDPINEIEDQYHPKHDKVKCWKILRVTAANNVDLLQYVTDGSIVTAAVKLGLIEEKTTEEEETKAQNLEGPEGGDEEENTVDANSKPADGTGDGDVEMES
jgi:hypothetical protein